MLQSGIRGFANAVKRAAVKDKGFAEELVYIHGLRSDITPNSLRKLGLKGMFNNEGKLTKNGQKEVRRIIKELNLPKNATWDDAFASRSAVINYKKSVMEIPKTEIPKLKEFNIAEFKNLKLKPSELEVPKPSMKEIEGLMKKYHLNIDV